MLKDSKQMTYNGLCEQCEIVMPQVRVEDIFPKRRKCLRRKKLYQVSENEFEEWLAVKLDDNKWVYSCEEDDDLLNPSKRELADEAFLKRHAQYLRAEYRYIKRFARWEQKYLKPLVEELACQAKNDPQYDWYFLYKLERQKLVCMEAYLSQSRVADKEGNYEGKQWIRLCIVLLDYILKDRKIEIGQIQRMNLRNVSGLIDKDTLREYQEAPHNHEEGEDFCSKCFCAQKIYSRKIERLYHLVRLQYTRRWWE